MAVEHSPQKKTTEDSARYNTSEDALHITGDPMIDPSPQIQHNGHTVQQGTPFQNEVFAADFRNVRLPIFWQKRPKLWFRNLESEFVLYRIRSDEVKFCSVVRHLDEATAETVAEILENPPVTDRYQKLKDALITRFSESEEKRLRQLLAGMELGDRKPTELLRDLRTQAAGAINETVLQTLWMQRLPQRMQETLAVADGMALPQLAQLADKVRERGATGTISSVKPLAVGISEEAQAHIETLERRIRGLETKLRERSKSRSSSRSRARSTSRRRDRAQSPELCFYHRRFGDKARKCTSPCAASRTEKQQEN